MMVSADHENLMEDKVVKDRMFRSIQGFLQDPPVIIWGSGATIPYGLPSMSDLKNALIPEIGDVDGGNLESILGEIDDNDKIEKIRKIVRDVVLKKDMECLRKSLENKKYLSTVNDMIRKFYRAHPQKMNIITTNYDRILEYALSQYGYDFTDGFFGRTLSKFSGENFKPERDVNVIKVHGSLNWFAHGKDQLFFPIENSSFHRILNPVMILPSKGKYEEAYREPYRSLITKADDIITKAKSFLVIGFGFNDEHLTPRVIEKINDRTPIVILARTATSSCKEKLEQSSRYCLIEKENDGSKFTYRNGNDSSQLSVDENLWELSNFMEEIL